MRLHKTVLHLAILSSLSGSALASPWPTAVKDTATTSDNSVITIPVLDNDIGKGLTLTGVNSWSVSLGRASINADNQTISYNKLGDPGSWPDTDSFWYTFKDDQGRTNAAKVTVVLGTPATKDWAVARSDSANIQMNTPVKLDVLANDIGVGRTIKEVNGSSVKWGRITIQDGQAYYIPRTGFTGLDEFWYVIENVYGKTDSDKVTINVLDPNTTVALGKLNDTGSVLCADFPTVGTDDNDLSNCSGVDAEGDSIPPNQDATSGRDVTDNNDSDGHAGFSFTKLDASGQALGVDATTWSCVKDNVPGLIWERKVGRSLGVTAAGLHGADDKYTWYNSDFARNGGVTAGTEQSLFAPASCFGYQSDRPETYCNTEAFVKRVNNTALCGITTWRLPNSPELQSILNYDGRAPTIETAYFPDTAYSTYITSSISVRNNIFLKGIAFYDGHIMQESKGSNSSVRLVSESTVTTQP